MTLTMGARKKEASRRERQGVSSDGMGNVKVKGENFYRYFARKITASKETYKLSGMLKSSRP